MVQAMNEAREAAAAGSPEDLRDWFDGEVFRKLVAQGYFSSNTCIALSISTDGFQAWRQRGLEGWPIIATVLNIDPTSQVQVVSQIILGIAPGPGQPADSESFFLPSEQSKAAVGALAQKECFKGYSLFCCPSPEDNTRYPALKYLSGIGPSLVPYDTKHLCLCNVVPRLWELFSGENYKLGDEQPWVIPKATREAIGREIMAGCKTVPLRQARSLRDITKHSGSYKAVNWLYFLLSTGEVVLAD